MKIVLSSCFLTFSPSKDFCWRAQEYTELSGVNLSSLLVAGLVSTALIVSILLLVYLGNEALRNQMFGVAIECDGYRTHVNQLLKHTRTQHHIEEQMRTRISRI